MYDVFEEFSTVFSGEHWESNRMLRENVRYAFTKLHTELEERAVCICLTWETAKLCYFLSSSPRNAHHKRP